ncbi:GNAT family N-acetyltransferase [Methanococcoides sp. SA1]|nr:GNAT family N-acetyltransferase [Methanococcoides sp. SA1]
MQSTKIRPLEENDFSELADFLKEGFQTSSEIWQRRFDMWWIDNPWMDRSIPFGWVIEDEKSEIVGFLGNIPVKYQIKGRDDIAATGTSLYVRPSVRGVTSLQLILAFARQKNIKLLLNTTANKTAIKIFSKLGFSDIDVPFNNLEYWYIRDYGKICDLYVRTNITSHRRLLLIKAPLVPTKLIPPFVRWFKDKRTFKLQPNHYKCSLCTDCDDSFTELWKKSRKENATTLCRDAETLKWIYFSKAVS